MVKVTVAMENSCHNCPCRGLKEIGSIEEKVARVVAIGSMIGFEVSEEDDEVLASIVRKEEEDKVRFEALSD
ncbi:hypothetical protein QYF36_024776 [Acer negundo]|nr:hypothetical protein QYF36_024776 [Acer negundo]